MRVVCVRVCACVCACVYVCVIIKMFITKLEDLKVLRRSPDLLDNCKTGQGQLQLIMKHILF